MYPLGFAVYITLGLDRGNFRAKGNELNKWYEGYIWIALALFFPGIGYAQSFAAYSYPQDGYTIEVPTTWQEKMLPTPTGGAMRAFMDADKKRGAGYCQVEVLPVDKNRTPKLAGMSDKKRRELLQRRWELDDWLQIYPNLASAQNFQVINSYPSEVGAQTPASAIEFRYSVPQGYFYHVRAHLALTQKTMYSLWCIGIGHGAVDAENNFRRYLAEFQTVAAKFKPTM